MDVEFSGSANIVDVFSPPDYWIVATDMIYGKTSNSSKEAMFGIRLDLKQDRQSPVAVCMTYDRMNRLVDNDAQIYYQLIDTICA